MSTNNLSSVLKSCSESELINEVCETSMTPKQVEGSRLKRTFTLPRNPFGTIKPSSSKNKTVENDGKPTSASSASVEPQREDGVIERKLFRRPSWKRFLNKIAQHMSTVNVSGVSIVPILRHPYVHLVFYYKKCKSLIRKTTVYLLSTLLLYMLITHFRRKLVE